MKGRVPGRSQRISIELFGAVCHHIKPNRCRKFIQSLLPVIKNLLQEEEDVLLLETLGNSFEPICAQLAPYFTDAEACDIIKDFCAKLSMGSGAIRRSSSNAVVSVVRHFPSTTIMRFSADTLRDLSDSGENTHLLQGKLHCFLQLFRLSLDRIGMNKFSEDQMLSDIVYCADLCLTSLTSPDNNVIVAALELLQVLFSSYLDYLIELWGSAKTETIITGLLKQFQTMMLSDDIRITSKSSLVTCCTRLASSSLSTFLFKNWQEKNVEKESLFQLFKDLLDHGDQTLRGQAAMFISEVISEYSQLSASSSLAKKIPGLDLEAMNIDVPELIEKLLHFVHHDTSSITAKMACTAIVNCWYPLGNSKYALWALYIIQSLLHVRPDAFRLVKTEIITFLSRIDYGLFHFLSRSGAYNKKSQVVQYVPCPKYLSGQQNLQVQCVDKIRTYLTDTDAHVRAVSAECLAMLPSQLHYTSYWQKDPQWSGGYSASIIQALPLSLRVCQGLAPYSQLRTTIQNPFRWVPKTIVGLHEQVDFESIFFGDSPNYAKSHWYLNEFVEGLHRDDPMLLKGIYKIFCRMAETHQRFPLPVSLVLPVILDQVETLPVGTDVDTQYDILIFLSHVVGQMPADCMRYAQRIFFHFVRVAYIVTAIIKKQPKPAYRELKPGVIEGTLPTIAGHVQYGKLWDRLSDTYRIGQGSFGDENMFEAIQRATFQGLTLCITQLSRDFLLPYVHELLGYVSANFDDKPLAVVECLRVLFVATFSLDGHPGSMKPKSTPKATMTHPDKPPPENVYSQLMIDTVNHPLFAPLSSRQPATGEANSWHSASGVWCKGGWDVAIKDVTTRQSPLQMNTVLKTGNTRQILQSFEPIVACCMQKYLATQDPLVHQAILQLLTTLVSFEVEFSALDKEKTFFRHVIAQVQQCTKRSPSLSAQLNFLSVLHLERRYLHNVLKVRMFSQIVISAFENWDELSVDYVISMLQVLHTLFSPATMIANETEKEYRVKMRKSAITALINKLPHPTSVQLTLYLLDILESAAGRQNRTTATPGGKPPPPSAPVANVGLTAISQPAPVVDDENRKRVYTDSKIPYLNHIATGVISLAENPWRLAKVDADDILGLLHLLSRLPTRTLKITDLADSLHQLIFTKVENKGFQQKSGDGVRDYAAHRLQSYWLPGVLLTLHALLKFDGESILACLAEEPEAKPSMSPSEESVVLKPALATRFNPDDSVGVFVNWMLQLIERISEQRARWSPRSTLITCLIIDSITFAIKKLMPVEVSASLLKGILAAPEALLSLSTSYQSACGFSVLRLLSALQAHSLIEQILEKSDVTTWHSCVHRSVTFLTSVKLSADREDYDYIKKHFEELIKSHEEKQAQDFEEVDTQSHHFLWLVVHHINEDSVKALCKHLCKDPKVAKYLQSFVAEYLAQVRSDESVNLPRHVPLMHNLMLAVTCISPSEETFQFLIDNFLSFPVMSVQLACENYFLKFTMPRSAESAVDKDCAIQVLQKNLPKLRKGFYKKLEADLPFLDITFTPSSKFPPKFVIQKYAQKEKTVSVAEPQEEDDFPDFSEKKISENIEPPTQEEIDWLISYVDKNSHPRRVLTELISVAKRSHNWDLMFKLLEECPCTQIYHILFVSTGESCKERSLEWCTLKIHKAIQELAYSRSYTKALTFLPLLCQLLLSHKEILKMQQGAPALSAGSVNFPSPLLIHHLCVDLLEYLTEEMVANSANFRPKPMVDCINLLTTLLQALSFSERLQIFTAKRSDEIYREEIAPPENYQAPKTESSEKSEKSEAQETEFEWRVRVVYRLYSLLFPQLSSSITNLVRNLEAEEKEQGLKKIENPDDPTHKTERILSFFWQLLCTCGTGNYGTNQRNSKFERVPFSYVHEEFLVLFYEFSKDPNPSGLRTRSLTDSKRHWYKEGDTPLLERTEEKGEEELEDQASPALPTSGLLNALGEGHEEKEKEENEEEPRAHMEVGGEANEEKRDDKKCFTREVDLYPFQEDVINFDNNEDPVENLSQFLRLLRGSNRAMSGAIVLRIWKQLFSVADIENSPQDLFAKTPELKVLAVRGLVILLLKWAAQISSEKLVPSGFQQLEEALDKFLSLLTLYVGHYRAGKQPDYLLLQRESIRAFVSLHTLMPIRWVKWASHEFFQIAKSFPELGEDPFVRQYVVVGLAKFDAEMHLENLKHRRNFGPPTSTNEPESLIVDETPIEALTSSTLDDVNLSPSGIFGEQGPPPRASTDLSTSTERMNLLTTLIVSSINEENGHEMLEQIASLQAILSLLQAHHPHRRVLSKNTAIINWINQKKDTKRESLFCTDLWKQKIWLLSSLLSSESTLDDVPLRDWTERVSESSQLFGLAERGENLLLSGNDGSSFSGGAIVERVRQIVTEANPLDNLMTNMGKVKELFGRIRARTVKEQQILAVSELAQVFFDCFEGEQILSFIFGELSRPVNNDYLITESLYKLLQVKSRETEENLRKLSVQWIVMCVDNFVQIVGNGGTQHVLLSLTALFLLVGAKHHPVNTVFMNDLYYGHLDKATIEDIFFISGYQFLATCPELSFEGKTTLVSALKAMNVEPFLSLANAAQPAIQNAHSLI
eukprot:TRINITY_DN6373_c0_g1_i1.p1 TRINITY_DN6373_c0_g1~~TRINITY_DN6373_c0_g1_i1.p1  ORF type:complete len:2698 (-),score=600.86 TRINITY_DN6373_c0_g1_i1:16-7797(-)